MNALCAIFLNFAVLLPGAQPGATIRGQVLDPAGAVIAKATIRVLEEGTRKTAQTARSDTEGRFVIEGLPQGGYLLAVSAPGFAEGLVPTGQLQDGAGHSQTIRLDILDCDAPGVNCDIFTSGPYTEPHPVRLQRNLTVNTTMAVDLDSGDFVPVDSGKADFRLVQEGPALYVVPINRAMFTVRGAQGICGRERDKDEVVRIDGLGPGTEILMKTNRGQCAKLFLLQEIAGSAASQAEFHIVTRAK